MPVPRDQTETAAHATKASMDRTMEFIARSHPTRRTVVIGGIAAGALAVVDPVCRQAGAATAVGPAPRDDTAYSLHGVTIADPYRPLEDASRADVKAWIDATQSRERPNQQAGTCQQDERQCNFGHHEYRTGLVLPQA